MNQKRREGFLSWPRISRSWCEMSKGNSFLLLGASSTTPAIPFYFSGHRPPHQQFLSTSRGIVHHTSNSFLLLGASSTPPAIPLTIIIINLIYIAQFDTNGILTALYIVITYIQMQYVHVCTYAKQFYKYTYTCLHIHTYTVTCTNIHLPTY